MLTSVNCKLTSLNVDSTSFGSKGLKHLCDALISTNCILTSLNVSYNQLKDEGIVLLCNVLISSNCTLTRLNVSSNEVGDRALKDLARALTNKNCILTSLDIRYNKIGDGGIKYLCKALIDTNCKLRSLDLGGNWKVTDVGKQCLSEAIAGTEWKVREGLALSRSSALSSGFDSISSTRESLQKQEELKKKKQGTKIEETEKMKGTSLSTKLSTSGHRKELEGKVKAMKVEYETST